MCFVNKFLIRKNKQKITDIVFDSKSIFLKEKNKKFTFLNVNCAFEPEFYAN